MVRTALLSLALFALFSSACSYLPSASAPVQRPPDEPGRLYVGVIGTDGTSQLGFSFVVADKADWTSTHKNNKKLDITLHKAGKLDGEMQQIEALIINLDIPFQPPERFMAQIKKNVEETYAGSPDFKLHAFEVGPYANNSQCVKSHILRQDTRGTADPNGLKKWHEQYALSCGSVQYKRFGFEIRYQQWYYTGNRDKQLENKAEQVFASFRIDDK